MSSSDAAPSSSLPPQPFSVNINQANTQRGTFRTGFGLVFGALCAIVVFFLLLGAVQYTLAYIAEKRMESARLEQERIEGERVRLIAAEAEAVRQRNLAAIEAARAREAAEAEARQK